MNEQLKMTYGVDLVFCIDCTGSMRKIIDIVKKNALNFYEDVVREMGKKHKRIDEMRIRVIAFRDYIADGDDAMLCTDFFTLPQEANLFEECVSSLVAEGGGDPPEDGLEALAYAIRSDWSTSGSKRRNIIVVWTDASTHPLGFAKGAPQYPEGMARDINELTLWWGDAQNKGYVNNQAKRLLLFAPDAESWNFISENWDNILHFPSQAGQGLREFEYGEILDVIANSI